MSVYKITGGDLCYIGSTIKSVNHRWIGHKHSYNFWKSGGKISHCRSFDIFDKFGIENCKIELLEEAETLKDRERFHIQNTVCVNRNVPNRTKKEYYQDNQIKLLEKKKEVVDCICGGKYTLTHKARHYNSKKHISLCLQPQSQTTRPSSSENSSLPDSQGQ